MRKHSTSLAALTAGAAVALISAPIASADDPPPPCAPDDQQCQEQQNPGAGVANQVIDNVQQGMDQAKQANEALNPSSDSKGPGVMVLLNGVPYCLQFGKPVPPGDVRAPDPSGMTSYC
jgi:hypothetical protein